MMRAAIQGAILFATWVIGTPTIALAESKAEIATNVMKASGAVAGGALFCGAKNEHVMPYYQAALRLAKKIDPTVADNVLVSMHIAALTETQLGLKRPGYKVDCKEILQAYGRSRREFGLK